MRDYIKNRVLTVANLYLKDSYTIRQVADLLRVSKSTVHLDLIRFLPMLDTQLAKEVAEKMEHMRQTKHLRGGEATRRKYAEKKNQAEKADA